MKHLLVGLGALAVVALFEGLVNTVRFLSERRQEELRRRLQALGGGDNAGLSLLRKGRMSTVPFVDDLLRGMPVLERLELLLDQAQVTLTVAQLVTYSGVAALAAVTLSVLFLPPLAAIPLALAAAVTPTFVVYGIREQRSRKLSEQLPDALEMMSRSLRAGHALSSAFKLVATEMPMPICVEFGRAFEEQNLGLSFEKAVLQMTVRAPNNQDMKIFAVSVIVQKETGGNLVEILEKIADTIRGRFRFYGKLRALTAEGKVSGIVLAVLPIGTSLVISILNPSYMAGLFNTQIGRNALLYGCISWLVGIIWLRKMGKVEL
jgi:tight adherence protein B